MNEKMLTYYSKELAYLKGMGKEFSEQYPKIASRLSLDFDDVPDPYVERILQGVSFLTARTQLKIDAEYPNFVRRILEAVHPQFLSPVPSSTIVKINTSNHYTSNIYHLERGYVFKTLPIKLPNQEISCEFSTTKDLELTPIQLESASYKGSVDYIPQSLLSNSSSVLRLNFSVISAQRCSDLTPKDLEIFLGADLNVSSYLLYLLMHSCKKVVCHSYEHPNEWMYDINDFPEHSGFTDDEALNFNLDRSISGIRLFQEYIQLPEKFAFISQMGVKDTLEKAENDGKLAKKGSQIETIITDKGANKRVVSYEKRWFSLSFLFEEFFPDLQSFVKDDTLSINTVPMVNLFKNKSIRLPVNIKAQEHHIVVDKLQPMNYEVHSVEKIKGFDVYNNQVQAFTPIYQSTDIGLYHQYDDSIAFFSLKRQNRVSSKTGVGKRRKTSYVGSEVFITLVNKNESIFVSEIEQLAVEAWCTNRDLPLVLTRSKHSDFLIENALPVEGVNIIRQVTKPKVAVDEFESIWSLLNQINLSFVSFQGHSPKAAAEHLKQLLFSFPFSEDDIATRSQINSIMELDISVVRKTIRYKGAGSIVNGVSVSLILDENLMGGVHPYVFCSIIRHFLLRSIQLNSFLRMSVSSMQKGTIISWSDASGTKSSL